MSTFEIILAPSPVFRQKARKVEVFDAALAQLADDMLETMYDNRGLGLASNMVGRPESIIVVDIQADGSRAPLVAINPEIKEVSTEVSVNEEASLSFPGISAEITRPNAIELSYQDVKGEPHTLKAEGWLAIVIQHEMDYLQGKTYLDHLSKVKKDRLLKKMQKYLKQSHSHGCGDPHCSHEH